MASPTTTEREERPASVATAPSAEPPAGASAAWWWIPTLYFAEGVPNEVVMSLAGAMYALLGIGNQEMALYTGMLYLPWVLKPLWSPLVDVLGTQRRWIIGTQVALAAGFLGVAVALPTAGFFFGSLCFLWVLAFSSATHDIAADGYYMSALPEKSQAWFVGIRSTFYRGAKFFVSAVLLAAAGRLSGVLPEQQAWAWTFGLAALTYVVLAAYHAWSLPPQEAPPRSGRTAAGLLRDLGDTFVSFFEKPGVVVGIAFLLLYRFSEAQLGKIAQPFMFASRADGGLALSPESVAVIYGTFGLLFLTLGGILGGFAIAKHGLRPWFLPMAVAINIPNVLYLVLATTQPEQLWLVGLAVSVEQFGYGFGFAAYLMYMLKISRGAHQTAHYALCTGFMALGVMLPSMASGWVEERLGYVGFFWWILVATIPSFVITAVARRGVVD